MIDNAIRHGAATELTLRVREQPGVVEIEVEDDGPGIPTELWSQVTERFGSSSPGGSGLGLSIAADVLSAHGGSLSFQNRAECGFAVIMRLPNGMGQNR